MHPLYWLRWNTLSLTRLNRLQANYWLLKNLSLSKVVNQLTIPNNHFPIVFNKISTQRIFSWYLSFLILFRKLTHSLLDSSIHFILLSSTLLLIKSSKTAAVLNSSDVIEIYCVRQSTTTRCYMNENHHCLDSSQQFKTMKQCSTSHGIKIITLTVILNSSQVLPEYESFYFSVWSDRATFCLRTISCT